MKKILLLLCFLAAFFVSNAQYPVIQYIGRDSSLVDSRGGFKAKLINYPFADTTEANTQRISQYPGALIYTTSGGGILWLRNSTATQWEKVEATGGSSGILTLGTSAYGLITQNDSTYKVDTALLSTKLWRQKGIDSVQANINLKVNISDTSTMLNGYTRLQRFLDSCILMMRIADSFAVSKPLGYLTQYSPKFTGNKLLYGGLQINPGPTYDTSWVIMSSQSNPWMFFMNGGTNKIGINNGYPATTMHIKNTDNLTAPLLVENNSFNTGVQLQVTGPMPGIAFNNGDGLRVFAKPPGNNDFEIFNTAAWGAGTTYHKFFADGGYSTLGAISSGSISLTASAQLALTSTTKGFLAPRLTTTERNAISSPAVGLMIYNTTDSSFQYYRTSGWTAMGTGGSGAVTDSLRYLNDELLLYQTGGSDLNVHLTTSTLDIDSSYNPLAGQQNDTTWRMKSLRIQKDNLTITPTITDSTLSWDIVTLDTTTVPLITFTAGAGFAADTAMVTDSSLFGSLFTGQYEYTITKIQAVIKGNSGDSVVLMIVYNDSFNVLGTKVTNAGLSVSSRVFGNTFDVYTNRTVPANQWLWMKPEAVIAGKKPKYISVTLLGYKTYVAP